jgi:hypothetical protein
MSLILYYFLAFLNENLQNKSINFIMYVCLSTSPNKSSQFDVGQFYKQLLLNYLA